MTPKQGTADDPSRPPLPTMLSSIEVNQISSLDPIVPSLDPSVSSEMGSDAPRKSKRRSGGDIDLNYRYHEPSDDELSWTEDEHGTRRRRKSRRKSGGDDFRTGIM
jgi:hypothetical protein